MPTLVVRAGPSLPEGTARPAADWGRYTLSGEIARGGMGIVLRGHDGRLNRELAVKVLHPQLRDAPSVVRRFTDEAQIGGRLQHPGVVPVYDLGILPDGRLFFAMKLVEGRTLSALLKERPVLSHDLPRFLKVFEQVCQTMAYAHSRGVLHRDLKPANVMVGAFGEVQVMDWGLAKVLASGGLSAPLSPRGRGVKDVPHAARNRRKPGP
jgi:serine/threonine-protein kinase